MFDSDIHDIAKEASEVARLERLTHHIQRIREGQDEMKASMQKMAEALTRLALVEERQANTGDALKSITETLKGLDQRLRNLEIAEPMQAKSSAWVERILWAVAGLGAMAVISQTGVL